MPDLLGTLGEILLFAAACWLGWLYLRGGTGTALSGLQHANRELVRQVRSLTARVETLEVENAALRAQTNVAEVIRPVIDAVRTHEASAAKRAEATLRVLDLIAKRIGPDTDL